MLYRRSRFTTRLPLGRRYTAAHYWIADAAGVLRIGFTKFATRMLGDLVEHRFEVEPDAGLALGARIGWVEGFKAVSEVFSVVEGRFRQGNPGLAEDPTLVDTDPYDRGWLYEAEGAPDPGALDAAGYAAVLDATIDRMLARKDGAGDA